MFDVSISALVAGVRPDGQRWEGRVQRAVGSETVISNFLAFLTTDVHGGDFWEETVTLDAVVAIHSHKWGVITSAGSIFSAFPNVTKPSKNASLRTEWRVCFSHSFNLLG